MTPLTMCPGTTAYMPPEALVTPPRYSNKLDCFSHGVLTIQIVTRQFPNPGDAQVAIWDARFPTGRVVIFIPESERRKKDIDLVDPNHPLLPLALHCLKDDDRERPSADELCGRLATLKGEQMYTCSVEQPREQSVSVQTLQLQQELTRARANHETELRECHVTFQQQIQEKDDELARARANHQVELNDHHRKLLKKCDELNSKESANEQLRKEIRELRQKQEPQKAPQARSHRKQEPQKVPKPALGHVTVQVSA